MFPKFKWSALVGLACAVGILSHAIAGLSLSPSASVQLVAEPPIARAYPLEAEATEYLGSGQYQPPIRLKLRAQDASGKSLQDARFHLQILTPAPTPWFTTDFPVVEGTKLLDIEGDAPTGELQMQQVFPIRGNYQLRVSVTPKLTNAFAPITQNLELAVPENPLKWQYFPFVLGALLAIGCFGGWIIGGRQVIQAGEIAPRRVRLLLSGATVLAIAALLFFNVSAELAGVRTHIAEEARSNSNTSSISQSQGVKLELVGDSGAEVGRAASFQAKLTDSKTNRPLNDAILSIKTTQLENNWVAFAYQGIPNAQGLLAWQEQFFDGAPHKIEVKASPQPHSKQQFPPLEVAREIDVEAIAPPMSVRLIGLLSFTGVLTVGLVVGLWLRRSRWQET
ncbi:hypothetical protein [Pseudanabaena sp. PCC 6802]|uniref:hypothetical protein n=1 Tax=Pseudanabaena sp. PCC 6802 TaxID=118173 RepID=UPI00034D0E25|nr:hypothetical protein [Pseudanabaena sp. PCC 6802]